ncbi:Hypothetical protein I595_1259 [Croceitalea dokdonensis DOKDO 023]|uniref:Uncharacterized protein n=1 Tax=Croceitalea dokdonensis DOKDO 023 TaxID=1300341 RepID=A0A0P7A7P4_9FLAO|nr:Hypothetical protein I595_1259 [Croceitalea dokdonensis DOKDO 023]
MTICTTSKNTNGLGMCSTASKVIIQPSKNSNYFLYFSKNLLIYHMVRHRDSLRKQH